MFRKTELLQDALERSGNCTPVSHLALPNNLFSVTQGATANYVFFQVAARGFLSISEPTLIP